MSADWKIGKSKRTCLISGKTIEAGDYFFSALREEKDSFIREDFLPEYWQEQPKDKYFSYWRTKMSDNSSKRSDNFVLNLELILGLFDSLATEIEENKLLLRYVIALLLTRKRVLRLEEIKKKSSQDFLILYDKRSTSFIEVLAPEASKEQLSAVQLEINKIFELEDYE